MLARGGFVIRRMRLEVGYSQVKLSDRYGVHKNTLSLWECGKIEPSFLTVFEIGRDLGFEIEDIYRLVNEISLEAKKAA